MYLSKLAQTAQAIELFPNPTTGVVQLAEVMTGVVQLYNTLGQVVYTTNLQEEQMVNLSTLESGVYFFYLQTDEQQYQQTVVVQK